MKSRMLGVLFLTAASAAFAAIPSPQESFGFPVGSDRKLADWQQLVDYYQQLAKNSDRVRFADLGKTTEGRPFVLLTISAPANLARLAEYQRIQRQLADPRSTTPEQAKALIARGKTILVITCNIHSTEIASSQTAAQFAWEMATKKSPQIDRILNDTIILLVPSLNPDGQQLVVDWYRKYLGTPYEGTPPVVLYQKYIGHDDNRDWYTFTQAETRLTVDKVLNAWHPQIVYDVHQMNANGPRIYLPPWVDPIDPNIDPILVQSMNALGTDVALELTAQGKTGVLVNGVYDLWSPARHYMLYHAGIRVLTESASAHIATPIEVPFDKLGTGRGYDAKQSAWNFPEPWLGGTWRLGDIIDYQLTAFRAIASNAAEHRERYLRQFYEVGKRAIARKNAPYAFVLPAEQKDTLATARLINILRFGLVEVEQAKQAFEADGKPFAAGSYIVKLRQPYGSFAKTLLEKQDYPNLFEYAGGPPKRPYDVTTQSLPLLFGVETATIKDAFQVESAEVERAEPPRGDFQRDDKAAGYRLAGTTNADRLALFTILKRNIQVFRSSTNDIYIPNSAGVADLLRSVAASFPTNIAPVSTKPQGRGWTELKLPRVALYKSWEPSLDEGWTRWLFEQDGIPYTSVADADIRKGDLASKFDAIIIPDNPPRAILNGAGSGANEFGTDLPEPPVPPEYKGGLGTSGLDQLAVFAKAGGTVIALNRASNIFLNLSGVPRNTLQGVSNKDFYGPGTLLRATVDSSNPVAFGLENSLPIFFQQSPAFETTSSSRSIVSYPSGTLLASGWLLGAERLKGASALSEVPFGDGRFLLFGFRPQYRAQSEATYGFLFNALFYAATKPASL
jgi:hypothetical protein